MLQMQQIRTLLTPMQSQKHQIATQTATDMTPEDPATGDEAADLQAGHLADHLHAAQHIRDAQGDTEAPHHTT